MSRLAAPPGPAKPRTKRRSRFQPAPAWTPLPRDIHLLWVLGIALVLALGVLVWGTSTFAVAASREQRFEPLPLSIAMGALGVVSLLVSKLFDRMDRADPIHRFFEWIDWSLEEDARRAAAAERKARAARTAPGDDEEEPRDAAFWVDRLSMRVARLERFVKLKAPDNIIESERRLIRDAIAMLPPAEALSVMRTWPELRERLDWEDGDELPPTTPKETAN